MAVALAVLWTPGTASADHEGRDRYVNPLEITIPGGNGPVETFADPHVIKGTDGFYYAYGTSDPLRGDDRDAAGALRFRRIPMARSRDLVHWRYVGDAFSALPGWMDPTSSIWAPDVHRVGNRYVMYYTVTNTGDAASPEDGCAGDSSIGAATSPTPTGPWSDIGRPVVEPRRNPGDPTGCNFLWTFDPFLLQTDNGKFLYYGSYNGGVQARTISADGLTTDPASARQIVIGDRYEGSWVMERKGWYYYMGSATDCCRGALTGYSVFAGRSRSPLGPFVDRDGVDLLNPRVGGTPVISMNGNRWVGTGHNSVITDEAGKDWFVYHAIDRNQALLSEPNPLRINRRPMLIDRLTWEGGWPSVRAGRWASDDPQPAPVTYAGGRRAREPKPARDDRPTALLREFSDEFEDGRADAPWSWIRGPGTGTQRMPGHLGLDTDAGDIAEGSNNAPVLVRPAPAGDFMIETKFTFDVPLEGIFNFRQAGIAMYQDDDRFVRAAHVSIWRTRQAEWAKEVPTPLGPAGQRYGNTVLGAVSRPGIMPAVTWLRIVKRGQYYTAYSSIDGRSWVRGGTWTHRLENLKIGVFALSGAGSHAEFDYVRTYRYRPGRYLDRSGGGEGGISASAATKRRGGGSPAVRESYSRR
jgi:arabinan endo-1,5-alpha-L-arabinosidase